jgi:hypothetical protein
MPAKNRFSRVWQWRVPGPRYYFTFEALVDGKTDNDRETACEAPLHLLKVLLNPPVANCLTFGRLAKAHRRWSKAKFGDVVWPQTFPADPLASDTLDAISDLRPAITADGMFDNSLIVVDKKPRRPKDSVKPLPHCIELIGSPKSVCRAAS